MSFILGFSSFYHDSAAALIHNGNIVGAVQEERFTRKKHDNNFPVNSIKYLLKESSLSLNDIEAIVFYEKPFLKFERIIETCVAFAPHGFKSFYTSIPKWLRENLFQKKFILDSLKEIDANFNDEKKIKFSEHHLSHAAGTFFTSPFEESLILTLDGVGEWATTTCGIGKNNNIEIIKEINFPHSIGLLYAAFTYYLGFKVNSGEYKVMGLAPYGEPKYKDLITKNLIDIKEDGSFRLNMKYFNYAVGLKMTNSKFDDLFKFPRRNPNNEKLTNFHMDVASSIQSVTEDILIKLVSSLKKKYNQKNLCLSGGVALNCVANGKILKNKIFENIYIQPASGDAGGSIGAALAYWHMQKEKSRVIINNEDKMRGCYIGPKFNNESIKISLIKSGINFIELPDEKIISETAKMLSEDKVVGWFQGRMEFGPRSLGNRSILANPRSENMQKKLNLKIKYRENFRPFAPSVTEEDANKYFNLDTKSPYMLLVASIKDELKIKTANDEILFGIEKLNIKRSQIPAVTHVDFSSRVQTVSKKTNLKFHKLLKKFEEITGFPILVNTSFNVRGEPIVNTPDDAIKCFMGTEMDVLVIENFIVIKKNQDFTSDKNYIKIFELD